MANGESFDMYNKEIVAHRYFPLETDACIESVKSGRSIRVTIKDRMPEREDGKPVDIDLSMAAAEALKIRKEGISKVLIYIIQ